MTTADFIAMCFWPLTIVLAVLLLTVRDAALFRLIVWIACITAFVYSVCWAFIRDQSLVDIVNFYIFMGVTGVGILSLISTIEPNRSDLKVRLKRYGFLVFAVGLVLFSIRTLFLDFARPRLVLEGRVTNVRVLSGRSRQYGVDIADQTVKATKPIYERLLKFKPYVRVEVGRGSEYIYKIDYLAD